MEDRDVVAELAAIFAANAAVVAEAGAGPLTPELCRQLARGVLRSLADPAQHGICDAAGLRFILQPGELVGAPADTVFANVWDGTRWLTVGAVELPPDLSPT